MKGGSGSTYGTGEGFWCRPVTYGIFLPYAVNVAGLLLRKGGQQKETLICGRCAGTNAYMQSRQALGDYGGYTGGGRRIEESTPGGNRQYLQRRNTPAIDSVGRTQVEFLTEFVHC